YGNSHFAPEAMYWRAVARYKATNDHAVLGKVAEELRNTYPSSLIRISRLAKIDSQPLPV
ncbi:MAG: hypothetical protein ABSF71_38070, partial [Terriglobia bacterium]